ncbi:hypothetical protein [Rhodovibrio salinarum]|uniref:Hemerythrin HHE cation binding domain-containing protein n=1 Tax=Rhodovibrio salinarum TaxID=1087 RepID=A0A934QH47_9PROT|nr:hypothetical protein [Rhodovibrio salinarum]MBK1696572.1 hypothetical protein [Rhodovibrio salinarum]
MALADRPLVFIRAQINSLRALIDMLESLGEAGDGARRAAVCSYLCTRLLAVLQDRRANVLPVMGRRAAPEDDADHLSESLTTSYDAVQANAELLVYALADTSTAERPLPRPALDAARTLALHLRQMVSLESSVLVPLLRVRLTTADEELLAAAFRARRESWPGWSRAAR